MRQWWLDKGWYFAWWVAAFCACRAWLVNPIIRAIKESRGQLDEDTDA